MSLMGANWLKIDKSLLVLPANDHGLVFTNEIGKPLDTQRIFEPALKRAGLRRVRFHDLRHSCAAALTTAGENIKWIQKQLGHSSIQINLDTYGHLLPEAEHDAPRRISKAFLPKLPSTT